MNLSAEWPTPQTWADGSGHSPRDSQTAGSMTIQRCNRFAVPSIAVPPLPTSICGVGAHSESPPRPACCSRTAL